MAVTYSVTELRRGLKVLIDDEPYLVVEYDFMKPGKGQSVYRTKMRNLLRGTLIERTYRTGDKVEVADVNEMSLEYSYQDAESFVFMDTETYEQHPVSRENMGDNHLWINEGMVVGVTFWNGRPISVDPPKQVELEVTYTEPAAKGNTASNVQKPATLSNGVEIQVPAFINQGDIVRVETATASYLERCSKS